MPFEWNMDYFSLSGYASVMALVLVFTLWFIHFIFKPQQIVCYLAMGMAIMAFSLGKHNSLTYVNNIQPDRSQQKAELEAKIAAEQQAVLDQRGEQVAQIRFAEDAEDEFLDRAGLDDEDLENLDNIREELTPDWKREKKKRSASTEGSEGEGMDTAAIAESAEPEPIVMLEADLMRANHFDYWNLQISKWCMGLGLLIILYDYIRRHNRYESAYFPLKIPSALTNLVTPYPSVVDRSSKPRRSVPEELTWLTKRGDPFVYFSSNSANTKEVDEALVSFFGKKKNSLQIIKTSKILICFTLNTSEKIILHFIRHFFYSVENCKLFNKLVFSDQNFP